jgi:1,4-alpha-glucan branching enzyme
MKPEHVETHDRQRVQNDNDREPRIAALADSTDSRSWYARSRSRVANGLLLTAPGLPMLFMGQEFLEDKYRTDDPDNHPGHLIWWDGRDSDRSMQDHHRFMCDLIWLRRRRPALQGESSVNPYYVHNDNRILAFHRWIEGIGRDVVVVASLNESTFHHYELGLPQAGHRFEVFNSDLYDHFPNPWVAGNGGAIEAASHPRDDMPASAAIHIPANGLLVFSRDRGS